MSQFITEIPVDLEAVLNKLPKRSFVESVQYDATARKVCVVWSNDQLQTPFSVPTPFPVQSLHDQQLPACVFVRPAYTHPPQLPANNDKVPVDTRKRRVKGGGA